jgi:phospholipase C
MVANPLIKHVFVLMLENRSFDHMLGFSKISGTDAETGGQTKIEGIPAGNSATNDATYVMGNDPGHEFADVLEQLTGQRVYNGGAYPKINNAGFVQNYARTGSATPNDILKCYDASTRLPVMTALAKEFAICDHWYASLPGPTWPNRFFVHAASSGGLDHSPTTAETALWSILSGFSFANGTIYDRLTKAGRTWRIYHGKNEPLEGSIPCVAALKGIKLSDTHAYENFDSDLKNGYPYDYTFIEPNYGNILNNTYSGGQSQHPMDDVRRGEALIKSTYESLRKSTIWLNSLLIITYDEHGGFYDHVPPPAAVPPGDTQPHSQYNTSGFPFDQYGVRVPALVISAYTDKNRISHLPYDHSSIPATLENMFGMKAMTKRDAAANTVCALASLSVPRTDTLEKLPDPAPMSAAQEALIPEQMAAPLPGTASVDIGNLPGFLFVVRKAQQEQHPLQFDQGAGAIKDPKTRSEARDYIEANLPSLLRKRN